MRSERASRRLGCRGPCRLLESCWSEMESHLGVLTRGVALMSTLWWASAKVV